VATAEIVGVSTQGPSPRGTTCRLGVEGAWATGHVCVGGGHCAYKRRDALFMGGKMTEQKTTIITTHFKNETVSV
jgi:hypothetical protein